MKIIKLITHHLHLKPPTTSEHRLIFGLNNTKFYLKTQAQWFLISFFDLNKVIGLPSSSAKFKYSRIRTHATSATITGHSLQWVVSSGALTHSVNKVLSVKTCWRINRHTLAHTVEGEKWVRSMRAWPTIWHLVHSPPLSCGGVQCVSVLQRFVVTCSSCIERCS